MSVNWQTLDRLRAVFLEGNAGGPDYWLSEADLASYDATFAQRIGWKWDYVLADLRSRGWQPPRAGLLDWACGSGIAARAYLDWFGPGAVTAAAFWDRSALAVQFATTKARAKYPDLQVQTALPSPPELVLLSHVLTELTDDEKQALLGWLTKATAILWVEPGTFDASRQLIAVREDLVPHFNAIAPCTHSIGCGLLAPGNERHWCHHFAPPPPGLFTDPFWGRFARMTGLDLGSLALSYLVLDRRPPQPLPPGTVRVLGGSRVYKAHAAVQACSAEGVVEWEIRRRELPEAFSRLRKGGGPSLQVWEREGDRITAVKDLCPTRAEP